MKYGSVCSGIEAASVAWHDLGWQPQWFSEIEQFPSEVLKHRFPDVPNLGDMTQLTQNPTFNEKPIDLLVGGTPCQSFSVAGLRKGLADPRGNLMLTFLALADAKKPKWIVWENVPGVLSSNGGKDFGTFLGALGELGYGFAYRVLDAQHFGVAQRRRRVFVVGYLGDWRPAGAVLFESESLQRDSKPSRAKRQETSTDAQGSVRTTSHDGRETIGTLRQRDYKGIGNDDLESGRGLAIEVKQVAQPIAYSFDSLASNSMKSSNPNSGCREVETSKTIDTTTPEPSKNQGGIAIAQPISIAENTIGRQPMNGGNGDGFTEDGPMYTLNATGVHGVAQPISWDSEVNCNINKMGTLLRGGQGGRTDGVAQPIAVDCFNQTINEKTTQTIGSSASDVNHYGAVLQPTIIDRAAFNQGQNAQYEPRIEEGQTMSSLVAKGPHAVAQPIAYSFDALSSNSMKSSNPNSGCRAVDVAKTLDTTTPEPSKNQGGIAIAQSIAVDTFNQTINERTSQTIGSSASDVNHYGAVMQPIVAPTLTASNDPSRSPQSSEVTNQVNAVFLSSMAIRRLTPKECERLQGFPDDWTKIPYRNKPADQCPDGPRYKACGNSMAVPVMRWIGERIQLIDTIIN